MADLQSAAGSPQACDSQNTSANPERALTKATDPAGAVDPDLHQLIDAWPNLPAPIRRAMLAVLEAGK